MKDLCMMLIDKGIFYIEFEHTSSEPSDISDENILTQFVKWRTEYDSSIKDKALLYDVVLTVDQANAFARYMYDTDKMEHMFYKGPEVSYGVYRNSSSLKFEVGYRNHLVPPANEQLNLRSMYQLAKKDTSLFYKVPGYYSSKDANTIKDYLNDPIMVSRLLTRAKRSIMRGGRKTRKC